MISILSEAALSESSIPSELNEKKTGTLDLDEQTIEKLMMETSEIRKCLPLFNPAQPLSMFNEGPLLPIVPEDEKMFHKDSEDMDSKMTTNLQSNTVKTSEMVPEEEDSQDMDSKMTSSLPSYTIKQSDTVPKEENMFHKDSKEKDSNDLDSMMTTDLPRSTIKTSETVPKEEKTFHQDSKNMDSRMPSKIVKPSKTVQEEENMFHMDAEDIDSKATTDLPNCKNRLSESEVWGKDALLAEPLSPGIRVEEIAEECLEPQLKMLKIEEVDGVCRASQMQLNGSPHLETVFQIKHKRESRFAFEVEYASI